MRAWRGTKVGLSGASNAGGQSDGGCKVSCSARKRTVATPRFGSRVDSPQELMDSVHTQYKIGDGARRDGARRSGCGAGKMRGVEWDFAVLQNGRSKRVADIVDAS